ncbi:hypothetical protein ES708_33005 [subsurface metagenome]
MTDRGKPLTTTSRLESLDAFRGFTMILLVSGGFGLYYLKDYPFFGFFARQVTHHQWHGMYFWDLIQPFFMFIVGVAMPFSLALRWERGESWNRTFLHVLRRSVTLFFLGVMLHCAYNGRLVWELWNVLTQLSVTYLVAFLFMRKPIKTQLAISLAILLFNYLAYRFIPLEGVTDPWMKDAEDAVTSLIGLVHHGEPGIHHEIMTTLASIGESAVPELIDVLKRLTTSDLGCLKCATESLKQIG